MRRVNICWIVGFYMSCLLQRKCVPGRKLRGMGADMGYSDNKEGVQSFLQKRPPQFTGTMDNTEVSAYPWWNPIDVVRRPKVEGGKSKL